MYCDICNTNYDNYYYKRHINTKKHLIELEELKKKLNNEEYNKYINKCKNKAKNTKYKKEKHISIQSGCFIISFK